MDHEERSLLPQLPLDDLLAELQGRLDDVRTARDGVHALLDAVVSIGRELEIETVLRRIVEAATTLVDARYGALGVIGEDGQLAQFVPVGITEEEIAAIEDWPHGRGILGLLIKDPHPLRLSNIRDHPESFGFPEGHPPMRSFLGVPIRIRDEVFGNLYLTEKSDGRDFDEQDETIVTARPSGTEPKIKFYASACSEPGTPLGEARTGIGAKMSGNEREIEEIIEGAG